MFNFNVIAIIGDGAQCNRSFQKKYFIDGDKEDLRMNHPITKKPIYYISDPSHVVKKIFSSLSSKNRCIHKSVDGKNCLLSLTSMFSLWISFNDNSGLNRFPSFKTIDFIKNSFQSMRVGPCIKILGPKVGPSGGTNYKNENRKKSKKILFWFLSGTKQEKKTEFGVNFVFFLFRT